MLGVSRNTSIHKRARKILPQACAQVDASCKGMLEAALRKEANPDLIRTDEVGRRYFVGDNLLEGYVRLCRSHHRRYDDSWHKASEKGGRTLSPEGRKGKILGGYRGAAALTASGWRQTPAGLRAAAKLGEVAKVWAGSANGRKAAARGSLQANHNRWHVRRGIVKSGCKLCA